MPAASFDGFGEGREAAKSLGFMASTSSKAQRKAAVGFNASFPKMTAATPRGGDGRTVACSFQAELKTEGGEKAGAKRRH